MPETDQHLSHIHLKVDGADASDALMINLIEVTVESSLHLPSVATITLHDPEIDLIDAETLVPGKKIEVAIPTDAGEVKIFDGEVVELAPEFGPGAPQLVVRAFDRLHRLARGRQVRSFQNVTDGDLAQKLAREAGLQAQTGPTSQVHTYVFQNNETNLEFLKKRAAALGFLVFVQGSTLHFEAPAATGSPVPLEWGTTLSEFRPILTTTQQVDDVTVRGWDPDHRQAIVGQAQNGHGTPKIGESRSGGELSHQAFNMSARTLVADGPTRTQVDADLIAQATADRSETRFIQAEGTATGHPGIQAGSSVQVSAIGDRFSGTYLVTDALHVYSSAAGYVTQFTVTGHHPATLLELLRVESARSTSPSLVIGLVTDNQDPSGRGRVKVKYPWLSDEHASNWARVVVVGGGPQRGIEFLPEVNDEVLIGFEQGDIHHPYVLGGLWNGQDKPPQSSSQLVGGGHVQKRIIQSRTGHVITLDDSDGGGGISIVDKSGNKIALDTASNALTIEVSGNARLKAQGNLSLEAQGQVQVKGMGVDVDGGAATVNVKGSVVNLN